VSRESEFLKRHKDDLTRAAEVCKLLQRNVVEKAPRTQHYLELMRITKRLEGTCRQLAHERGDDFTWLRLGDLYVRVGKSIQSARNGLKWAAFGDIAKVFEAGIARLDRLAHTANGITSLSRSSLLILPAHLQSKPSAGGLILP
jgi:hypothetical protein